MVNNHKTGDSFIKIRMTHESGQFVFVTKDVRNNEATRTVLGYIDQY